MLSLLAFAVLNEPDPASLKAWGLEVLESIRRDLYLPDRKLYAEEAKVGQRPSHPAFNWPAGVQLSALNAAAELDRKYLPWAVEYADAMRAYWRPASEAPEVAGRKVGGFDVLPLPKSSDRYYDDNAWFVLAYAETYELSKERRFLQYAREAYDFAVEGWDDTLDGGVFWRENERTSKNTCSNAPTAAGALELYRLTRERRYLDDALKILAWTRSNLQDPSDGLMWDAKNLDGTIGRAKWTYNTALMIRSYAVLAQMSSGAARARHLAETSRMIDASIRHWGRADGSVACDAAFAHLLTEAILIANKLQPNPTWQEFVAKSLEHLHNRGRDAQGRYPKRWDQKPSAPLSTSTLIQQASAARAYLFASSHLKG